MAYCPVAVFDAPVYARKRQREEVLSGRVDTLADRAVVVRPRRAFSVPYEATVPVPESFTGGRIVAVVTANGCGESRTLARPDMALIANLPTLIDPQRDLLLNWIEPEFVIRPKVVQGRGEARLQFAINHYDINLALGDNRREMDAMLGTLQRIVSDSLMTLNSLAIYGMASADGPLCVQYRPGPQPRQFGPGVAGPPPGLFRGSDACHSDGVTARGMAARTRSHAGRRPPRHGGSGGDSRPLRCRK